MNLSNGFTDHIPADARHLDDMPVLMRDRTRRTKHDVMDRSPSKFALRIDSGLLGDQLLAADDIGRITGRQIAHRPVRLDNASIVDPNLFK